MDKALSLESFAKAHPTKTGSQCWMCNIPERKEAEAGRKAGYTCTQIRAWLIAKGYPAEQVTKSRVDQHLRNHVK